ncbi:MAG: enoyl-CoA hydratase/isomerase family protein [Deltaproteobacteria bacterium]|nr:enoyl-CoA hydratase/isomerase family protein [Deltaproteobacteria bacterium]
MGMVKVEMHDTIAVLELENGVTNAISPGLVADLAETLLEVQTSAGGIVLSGNEKFFSMGFNLPELIGLDRAGMKAFLYGFNAVLHDIYTLPMPTAVAIEGHAIAGGTILALVADFRLAAAGKKMMGLNEIKLGLPVPYLALMILGQVVSHPVALEMIYHGEFVKAEKAYDMGLVDEITAPGSAVERAIEKMGDIAGHPAGAFAVMKATRVAAIRKNFADNHVEQHEAFLDCWFGAKTRALLKEAAAKFKKGE